jgi:hypothetical protein
MIIRVFNQAGVEHLREARGGPEGIDGTFGRIDVLRFTSVELKALFGISLAEVDVENTFSLAEALRGPNGRRTVLKPRNNRLARVMQQRPYLFPCFVAYQEVPGLGLLPFMSDGPSSGWSMFFEADGRMTLVDAAQGSLVVTADEALSRVAAEGNPDPRSRPFLLNPLKAAKKVFSAAKRPFSSA